MEIKEIVAPLQKWWWFIIIATLLAGGVSYLAVSRQPLVYEARTTLMIGRALDNPNPGGNEFGLSQQLAAAYADIAKREAVREETMAALGMSWLPEYRVWALPNSVLIDIVVVDTSPERAQAVANELANQLVLRSPTTPRAEEQEQEAFIKEELADLQTAITTTREEISAKQEELRHLVSAQKISETQIEINGLQTKLNTLQSTYASLLANTQGGAINTLSVIDRASLPRRPVGPNVFSTVATSAALGFVMATMAAYLLVYLDDTIKEPAEVTRLADLPVLASVTKFKAENDAYGLFAFNQPRSPVSEAFRWLRATIHFSNIDKPPRKLLITSPGPNEGKSVTAANLAIVMAQAGHKVLLVDADLHQPKQHIYFGLNRDHGLTDLLLLLEFKSTNHTTEAPATLQGFIQPTAVVGLSLLSSGPLPPNPSEVLGSTKMKVAMSLFSGNFDFVIVDSPPCLVVTDAAILSTQMDGVVVIVRAGQTRRSHLKQGVERLREAKANLIGVSLNGLPSRSNRYAYYAHSESYYSQTAEVEKKNGDYNKVELDQVLPTHQGQQRTLADDN